MKGIPVLVHIFIDFQFSYISLGTIKMAKCSNSKGVNFAPKSSFKLSSIKTKLRAVTIPSVNKMKISVMLFIFLMSCHKKEIITTFKKF